LTSIAHFRPRAFLYNETERVTVCGPYVSIAMIRADMFACISLKIELIGTQLYVWMADARK